LHTEPRAETIGNRFGSLAAALLAAGITPARRPTATEVLASLRAAAQAQGRPPRYSDWRRREPPNVWDVARHFESWNAGLRAADIEPLRRPTRDEVIGALRMEARARGGEPPRSAEWKRSEPPTVADVDRHFGSWNAAVRAAGLTPRPQVAKPTRAAGPR
jgi:Homing endonuclease associated repeat